MAGGITTGDSTDTSKLSVQEGWSFHRGLAAVMAMVGGTDLIADRATGRVKGRKVMERAIGSAQGLVSAAKKAREAMLHDMAWSQDPACSMAGMDTMAD